MTDQNPYQPPAQHEVSPEPSSDLPDGWVRCPQCQGTNVQMPGFTWWGGALGQKLLDHVKCQSCSHTYNAKTGKSNTPAIVIYQVVMVLGLLGIFYALDIF